MVVNLDQHMAIPSRLPSSLKLGSQRMEEVREAYRMVSLACATGGAATADDPGTWACHGVEDGKATRWVAFLLEQNTEAQNPWKMLDALARRVVAHEHLG